MHQQQWLEEPELSDGVVGGIDSLDTLLAADAHTDVSRLNHVHIVCAITCDPQQSSKSSHNMRRHIELSMGARRVQRPVQVHTDGERHRLRYNGAPHEVYDRRLL